VATGILALLAAALAAGTAGAQKASPDGGRLVVFPLVGVNVQENITDASTEVLKSALRNQGFDVVDWEEAAALAELTSQRKAEIARGLGCTAYIDGMLVRLGTKIRVSINKRDLTGKVIDDRQTEAKTEDDLVGVLERIAMAFAGDTTVDETLDLDNATMAEAQRQSNRFRLEKNFGAMIGGTFGIGETMDTAGVLAFDGRLEIKDLLLIINAGIGFSADDDYDDYSETDDEDNGDDISGGYKYKRDTDANVQAFIDVAVAYYLLHKGVSPYIGAGFGVYFGGRVNKEGDRAGLTGTDNINGWERPPMDSEIGFELFPVLGLEVLRQTSIRVHLEFRYSLNFGSDSAFGHGPVALAGVCF
jgi:hypothetical protein